MLEKVKSDLLICGRCGKCIVSEFGFVCPVHQHTGGFDESAARGRNSIGKALMEGKLQLNQEIVDNTYTCLSCKRCQVACGKLDANKNLAIDECKITQTLRNEIVKAGMEPEVLKAIDQTIEETHNPFGLASSKRAAWADGLDLPTKGEVVYFAGCYAAYRKPKIAKATVAILKAGGIDVAYMGEDEWCCGVPQLGDGNLELAEEIMMHNIKALKEAGCKKIITSCAGCFHALKSEYPEIAGEMPFEVLHTSEVIADLIKNGKLEFNQEVPGVVTFHDPCHLGRHEGVYEAPREILEAIPGLEMVEMKYNKETAMCCGGGSIVSNVYPELTADIASDRIKEAKETGAEMIVSACPSCETNLTTAGRRSKLKVEDINIIVAKAMGIKL
jgi:heterodisulfide reductase subunit D